MPFSPSDLTNLKLWLKADAGAGSSNNDPVGTWTDQSGQGHDFTQATSGKKPLYQTNKRNGLPAVVFDGSDDQLDGGNLSAVFTNAATMMVAVNNIPGGGGKMMVWESKNNDPWWVFTGNAGYWGLFRATRLSNTPSSGLSPSGWSIWALTADNGSNYKVWTDNTLKINDTGGFTFDGGNAHNLGHQTQNNEYKQMEVGEIVATSDVLGSTDFQNLYDYMAGRWGTVTFATPSATAGIGDVPSPAAYGNESYSAVVLADAPVAYWRLGETSGTNAADSSGNGHDGTYTNGPTLNQSPLITEASDRAVSFDGSNDYIDMSNPSALRFASAWTLEGWVKVQTGQTLIGTFITQQYDGARVPFQLGGFDGSGHTLKPACGFYNGSWHTVVAPSAITANTIHHLVGTWDGTTLRIYVDGVQVNSSVPGSSPSSGDTGNIYVGSRWDNNGDGQKYAGTLDEIAVWDRALSAGRIQAHYIAGTATYGATATPSATAGIGAVPAPTLTGAARALPSSVAGVGAVPAPTAMGNATASPSTTAGVGAVPAATAVGTAAGTAAPNVVTGAGAIPAPTVSGIGLTSATVVAGVGAVPAPTGKGVALVVPNFVDCVGTVPSPSTAISGSGQPSTVAGVGRVPHPHARGEGTGGGGGSPSGATDFWSIKLGV